MAAARRAALRHGGGGEMVERDVGNKMAAEGRGEDDVSASGGGGNVDDTASSLGDRSAERQAGGTRVGVEGGISM